MCINTQSDKKNDNLDSLKLNGQLHVMFKLKKKSRCIIVGAKVELCTPGLSGGTGPRNPGMKSFYLQFLFLSNMCHNEIAWINQLGD